MTDTARRPLPPMLYVPSAGPSPDGSLLLDFRRIEDGRLALLAYTALDRLHAGCGTHQPWALLATQTLDEINAQQPYDLILLDVSLPAELRRTAAA
ncbi:SAV_915 family protein [Sanguibacter antarcticus]|uniref:Uncharacterized protein n=1 Tax=Sanguibacter antarcticus TaxID=372484 RepID=A0A2A9E6Q2_9MICO|nr:SAV_915 family protein [Sanguibacter antarcticus]PFG34628.1 hypothetical protein ATL42_2545 [Sanguibacter antarcticus]